MNASVINPFNASADYNDGNGGYVLWNGLKISFTERGRSIVYVQPTPALVIPYSYGGEGRNLEEAQAYANLYLAELVKAMNTALPTYFEQQKPAGIIPGNPAPDVLNYADWSELNQIGPRIMFKPDLAKSPHVGDQYVDFIKALDIAHEVAAQIGNIHQAIPRDSLGSTTQASGAQLLPISRRSLFP